MLLSSPLRRARSARALVEPGLERGAAPGSAAALAPVPGVIRRSRAVDLLRAARSARRLAAV